MMDKSFVEQLANMADHARVIPFPHMPSDRVAIEKRGGEIEIIDVPAGARNYRAETLAGMVQQIKHLANGKLNDVVVFVGKKMVTAVFDENGERRHFVRFSLEHSEQHDSLDEMERERRWEQRDLVWELTSKFRRNIVTDGFLGVIRSLKFSSGTDVNSTVKHGDESVGAEISARVALAANPGAELPDLVEFEIPVFRMVDIQELYVQRVRCAVRFLPEEKRIVIRPEPGELAVARANTLALIAEDLRATLVSDGVAVLENSSFG